MTLQTSPELSCIRSTSKIIGRQSVMLSFQKCNSLTYACEVKYISICVYPPRTKLTRPSDNVLTEVPCQRDADKFNNNVSLC